MANANYQQQPQHHFGQHGLGSDPKGGYGGGGDDPNRRGNAPGRAHYADVPPQFALTMLRSAGVREQHTLCMNCLQQQDPQHRHNWLQCPNPCAFCPPEQQHRGRPCERWLSAANYAWCVSHGGDTLRPFVRPTTNELASIERRRARQTYSPQSSGYHQNNPPHRETYSPQSSGYYQDNPPHRQTERPPNSGSHNNGSSYQGQYEPHPIQRGGKNAKTYRFNTIGWSQSPSQFQTATPAQFGYQGNNSAHFSSPGYGNQGAGKRHFDAYNADHQSGYIGGNTPSHSRYSHHEQRPESRGRSGYHEVYGRRRSVQEPILSPDEIYQQLRANQHSAQLMPAVSQTMRQDQLVPVAAPQPQPPPASAYNAAAQTSTQPRVEDLLQRIQGLEQQLNATQQAVMEQQSRPANTESAVGEVVNSLRNIDNNDDANNNATTIANPIDLLLSTIEAEAVAMGPIDDTSLPNENQAAFLQRQNQHAHEPQEQMHSAPTPGIHTSQYSSQNINTDILSSPTSAPSTAPAEAQCEQPLLIHQRDAQASAGSTTAQNAPINATAQNALANATTNTDVASLGQQPVTAMFEFGDNNASPSTVFAPNMTSASFVLPPFTDARYSKTSGDNSNPEGNKRRKQ